MKNMIALTGIGYDIHRFAEVPRPLMLGGVHIPSSRGLDGHSDADVLCHAIADALLGAAGLPDIGYWFPPGDPSCKDIRLYPLFFAIFYFFFCETPLCPRRFRENPAENLVNPGLLW